MLVQALLVQVILLTRLKLVLPSESCLLAMLVGELFDGPLDIVGDIHGEVGQLQVLLYRLGYDTEGVHPEGRHLVFVGDLVDRGPDSPGVVQLVRPLVEKGQAQLVLGNHEINLIRDERKHGNHWFWAEKEQLCNTSPEAACPVVAPGSPSFQVPLQTEVARQDMVAFLSRQPIALERKGLRVVHAMWHQPSVDKLKNFQGHVGEAFSHFQAIIQQRLEGELQEASQDERDMAKQNDNPVTVLTTGMEVPAKEPYFAGGKMRTLERHPWWEEYSREHGLVVIGHYWRRLPASVDVGIPLTGPSLFPDEGKESTPSLLGASQGVMCVDYSAGLRFEERGRGLPEGSLGTALAALRVPEMTLHFSDGRPPVELK